jgi:hypothetical protein
MKVGGFTCVGGMKSDLHRLASRIFAGLAENSALGALLGGNSRVTWAWRQWRQSNGSRWRALPAAAAHRPAKSHEPSMVPRRSDFDTDTVRSPQTWMASRRGDLNRTCAAPARRLVLTRGSRWSRRRPGEMAEGASGLSTAYLEQHCAFCFEGRLKLRRGWRHRKLQKGRRWAARGHFNRSRAFKTH